MTPAEWLAIITLGSAAYGLLEGLIAPDAVIVNYNNGPAVFIRCCFAIAILVLAFVVLL